MWATPNSAFEWLNGSDFITLIVEKEKLVSPYLTLPAVRLDSYAFCRELWEGFDENALPIPRSVSHHASNLVLMAAWMC